MNGRGQLPFIVVPDHLAYPTDHVLDRGECAGPIDLCVEPLPKALNGSLLRGIRLQMFQDNPVMVLHEAFHQ